jgi:hypothetical protein
MNAKKVIFFCHHLEYSRRFTLCDALLSDRQGFNAEKKIGGAI